MIYNNPIYRNSIEKIAHNLPIQTGRILITGASGLIGSCLVDVFQIANSLVGNKFEIFALGRNEERLKRRFHGMKHVNFIVQDVTEPIKIENLDYIIHAASNADPRSYALYPAETILTNVIGTKNILDYCKYHPNVRALLLSSFEVYGKQDQDYYHEDDFGLVDINQLRSSYPESKRTAELLFRAYYDEYNTNCLIARLSSIYGPTMLLTDSKAHAQFLKNAINGEDIVLKSEGTQKRTYCYVIDAVSGLLEILFKGEAGEAYNVANDQSIATIAEVAHTIAKLANTKVKFELPDDIEKKGFSKPQNCILITNKLKALGWKGNYTLIHGMHDTLEILKNM